MIKLGIYQHVKGNFYQVIGVARHTETLEELVVYQAMQGDYGMWVRPITAFLEEIEHENQKAPRFKFVSGSLTQFSKVRM